jgi:hypothetical protein
MVGRHRGIAGRALVAIVCLGVFGCDFSSVVVPSPTVLPIRILLFDGGSCPLAGFSSPRMTFRIDPTASNQVVALDAEGGQIRVWWPEGLRGGTSEDPVVRDPRGLVVARDGEVLTVPADDFPNLHGYSVCSGGDGVGDAIWVQLHPF